MLAILPLLVLAVEDIPNYYGGNLAHLRGQGGMVRHIKFLGSLQSLLNFPCGVYIELRFVGC